MGDSDISVEFDDFEIERLSEKQESGNDADQPSTNSPIGFQDASEKYKELVKEMERIDEIAVQLKLAIDLRSKMEDCYSSRCATGGAPISASLEIRCLSTGSLLCLLSVKNSGSRVLNGWYISISWDAIERAGISNTRTIFLHSLESGVSKTFELFIDYHTIIIPSVITTNLMRSFEISKPARVMRISLDRELISLLNLLKSPSQPSAETKAPFGSFSLSIPCSLVNLLCGCPDVVKPFQLLRLFLRVSLPNYELPEEASVLDCNLMVFNITHPVRFEVVKSHKLLNLVVFIRDSEMRRNFQRDLQLFIIVKCSGILSFSPSEIDCSRSERNINDLFLNVLSKFS